MRCAFAEAAIAEQLSNYIFQDFYVSASDMADLRGLTEVLTLLDKRQPRKASIARCQITMALDDSREQKFIISRAVETVYRLLSPWIPDSRIRNRLGLDLTNLFRDAMDLWRQLQRDNQHAIATLDVTSDQWYVLEDTREQYDKVTVEEQYKSQKAALESTAPIAVLFPQIWIGGEIIFNGYALFPSQSAVIAASLENRKKNVSRDSIKRRRQSGNGTLYAPDQSTSEKGASNTSKHRVKDI